MNAVIAIDSFKGSLSSMEAGKAAAEGIWRVDKDAKIAIRPLADGGEGTVEALTGGMNGEIQTVTVTGPLGEPAKCEYGIIENSHTAVIEMSGAAGITLVPAEKRNPLYTTTYGVGEVIKDAIAKGGSTNMLTGAERSKTLWELEDKLSSFSHKLHLLYISIRHYRMSDGWNRATAGMIERDKHEVALQSLSHWKRYAKEVSLYSK